MVDEPPDREDQGADNRSLIAAAPSLLRLYAAASVRTVEWTLGSAVRTGRRLTEAAVSGESTAELIDELRAEVRAGVRRLLEATDMEERVGETARQWARSDPRRREETAESLRVQGAELLDRAAQVEDEGEEGVHLPAYARILAQLAPDEARILRLLATEGPQAYVDVRTWRPLGIGSQLVESRLSLIDRSAGCMHPERVPAYLNNLFRLGLIWFSRDPVRDPDRYVVLEAQPEVLAAMKRVGRARTVRRSVRITPFGADFCEICLDAGGQAAGREAGTAGREAGTAEPEADEVASKMEAGASPESAS